jgi:spore maturation protein CgeB
MGSESVAHVNRSQLRITSPDPVVIVGGQGGTNIGGSLSRAATNLGLEPVLLDASRAFVAPWPIAKFNWWLRGHRPTRLSSFSEEVVDVCRRVAPQCLITTGHAPVERAALDQIRSRGIPTISYLTDDPWNPTSRSEWLLQALPAYTHVFSCRRANLSQLRELGCAKVDYLPFGFDPELFFPDRTPLAELAEFRSDVLFAGGADRDRVPYLAALIREGFTVHLYGDYWNRFPETRAIAKGLATPATLRKSIRAAAVCLCLVRRVNRDGHCMRTFEVPAAGGCMLTEDTDEHRAIFGPDDEAVLYFGSPQEMVIAVKQLLGDPVRRARLAENAHRLITEGSFTYLDRLRTMLTCVSASGQVLQPGVTSVY